MVAEIIILGAFAAGDASGLFKTISGKEVDAGLVFVVAILIIGATALARLGALHDRIDDLEGDVRVTAKIGRIAGNVPDPGPDKTSLTVDICWEIWIDRDVVATDKLALNLIYVYDKAWWKFWQKTRFPQTGIPRQGKGIEYREKIYNNMLMPWKDHGTFEYMAIRTPGDGAHWLLELVLVTGVPKRTHRIPVAIDDAELQSRGTNPPL